MRCSPGRACPYVATAGSLDGAFWLGRIIAATGAGEEGAPLNLLLGAGDAGGC